MWIIELSITSLMKSVLLAATVAAGASILTPLRLVRESAFYPFSSLCFSWLMLHTFTSAFALHFSSEWKYKYLNLLCFYMIKCNFQYLFALKMYSGEILKYSVRFECSHFIHFPPQLHSQHHSRFPCSLPASLFQHLPYRIRFHSRLLHILYYMWIRQC